MPLLLVSASNLSEALLAASAGADVVDLKQPARGSLGAVERDVVQATVEQLGGQVALSAALGELLDAQPPLMPEHLEGFRYAKWGLAGCADQVAWADRWREQTSRLPPGVSPVAVVYADADAAAPPPREILAAALSAGAQVVLVDTWAKQKGHLLAHWSYPDLAQFAESVHAEGLKLALAGSLNRAMIEQVLPVEPDVIGVRRAVCRGGRSGQLDPQLVRQFAALVHQITPAAFGI